MNNLINVTAKVVFASILLLAVQQNSFACNIHNIKGGVLFDREFKKQASQDVANGPMILQEDESEHFTQGYRPQSSVSVSGTYCQEVYDFGPSRSAHELFHSIKKSQQDAGYKVGYECAGSSCGKVDGWRLFLSEHIAGSTHNQKFLMTYLGGDDFFVVSNMIHVTEFDNQARVVVTSLFRPEALKLSLISKENDLFDNHHVSDVFGVTEVGSLYFGSNIADSVNQERLNAIANRIKAESLGARFLVIGYADTDGARASNQKLSLARANAVAQNLFEQHQVDKNRLHAIGKGEISGRDKARRVTVYRVPEN